MPVTTKARSRSIAHRWGPMCPSSLPAGSGTGDHWALGIRFDEEDESAADTFVVRLGPGRTDIVDQLPGRATALATSSDGKVFVLDDRGQVIVGGRRHKLAAPRALSWLGDGVVLAGADRLWTFSADGAHVTEGPAVKARKLASCSHGVAAALDDGTLLFFDDILPKGAAARGQALALGPVSGGVGHVSALATDDDGRVAAASGRTLLLGSRGEGRLTLLTTAPFDVHAIALHEGRVLLSSRVHGLFTIEMQDGNGNGNGNGQRGLVMPLRPSLRAHTLAVRGGVLAVASDLFVATSDGAELQTRDLGPFVRQAEQRLPRFHSSEDPLSV